MQTPASDETTQKSRREPLRWLAAAALLLAFLSICCVAQAVTFLLAPQFLSFWPSPVDWRLALRSWPWAVLIALGGIALFCWHRDLFQFVKA